MEMNKCLLREATPVKLLQNPTHKHKMHVPFLYNDLYDNP